MDYKIGHVNDSLLLFSVQLQRQTAERKHDIRK